ncbi:MAG: hypothetical protein FOGNACKC_00404 [Anaerolineae bacterium]|nr:hypothetical protein [Anaerolineae bacterium]
MKPLGHLAGGYLAARALLNIIKPAPKDELPLLALGTAAGILPDLDGIYHVAATGSLEFGEDYDHHRWISHTFPFYWLPLGLVYGWGRLTHRRRVQQAALVVAAGVTTHLLQDAVGSGTGLMWAWPVSRRMDGICTLHVKGGKAWLAVYNRHPIAWVERLTIVAALLALLRQIT